MLCCGDSDGPLKASCTPICGWVPLHSPVRVVVTGKRAMARLGLRQLPCEVSICRYKVGWTRHIVNTTEADRLLMRC